MAIHCMLLTGDNIKIVQNFLSEFKDKYDCMQTFDMVRSMISAWQSANFKDGEEPTMPTKDEMEKFIQSQIESKQSSMAPVQESNTLLKNINNVDKSLVDVEQHNKPWKSDSTKSNKTLRVYLKDHSKGYFELVKDEEDNFYYVHF